MNFILKKISELNDSEKDNFFQSGYFKKNTGSWKYSPININYYHEYFGPSFNNNSFVIYAGKEIVAFSLIYMDEVVSFFNMPIDININPLCQTKKIIFLINEYLLSLCKSESQICIYFNDLLFYEFYAREDLKFDLKKEYNYYIDLSHDINTIKSNFRKSYKSLVNWSLKNVEYRIVNKELYDQSEFNSFKDFHFFVSGHTTRSEKSWELQAEMVKNNDAVLINGYFKSKLVSSSFNLINDDAYYGVGVYDRNLMAEGFGIAHGSLFMAIQYLKEIGINKYYLGIWDENQTLNEKDKNIIIFKRGLTNTLSIKNLIVVGK